MDYRGAIAFLDQHTNLEGNRSGRFDSAVAAMPTAGQVGGLSLKPMQDMLSVLGDPQNAYRTIHITGTNGKGSTARTCSQILRRMELSVGLYTSPNLDKVNERLSWDGNDITDEQFAQVMGLIAGVAPMLDSKPSRFELLTTAALVWFAELGVEVAVLEVGLLGRFDATNVVDADVAVITNIGKDHTDGKPGWQRAVAEEKAGIIKPASHVILGSPMEELLPIFEAEAQGEVWEAERDFQVDANLTAVGGRVVDIRTPGGEYEELFVPLHGAHQGDNVATAIAAVEAFFQRPTADEIVRESVADLQLPGRFEVVGHDPIIILDGAHNPHGAEATRQTLDEEFARLGSWVLVVGMLSGKDPIEMLEALDAADFDAVICTEPNWSRAIPAKEIAAAAKTLGITAEVVLKPVRALERAHAVTANDDLILVAGSLYVVGEIRSVLAS